LNHIKEQITERRRFSRRPDFAFGERRGYMPKITVNT
jgi:hypothetical protein